jgi:hypothetical protein
MIGFKTEMRALAAPPKNSLKNSVCFVAGADILIDQATILPL